MHKTRVCFRQDAITVKTTNHTLQIEFLGESSRKLDTPFNRNSFRIWQINTEIQYLNDINLTSVKKKWKSWESSLHHAINFHFRITNLKFIVFHAKFFIWFFQSSWSNANIHSDSVRLYIGRQILKYKAKLSSHAFAAVSNNNNVWDRQRFQRATSDRAVLYLRSKLC